MRHRLENMKTCPICGAVDIQLFMEGIFDSDTTNVMECSQCGTQFLDPLMTEEEEAVYYDGYYRNQRSRHFKEMELADQQQRTFEHYEQYKNIYLKLISGCNSILEIGSGTGGFLRFVRLHKPETSLVAVERCKDNITYMKSCFGNDVEILQSLNNLGGRSFDFIGAFGVFEHVRDSRKFLADARALLSIEGRLALNVPNKYHALVYEYDLLEFRKFTYMKQHYFTFTERSFTLLATISGLTVRTFNYLQVWGLDNHLSWLRYKKPRDFDDISRFLSPQTIDSYNNDLIARKATDLMMVVMGKNSETSVQ